MSDQKNPPWCPSVSRLNEYRLREIDMAARNIQTHGIPSSEDDTLHSKRTVIAALSLMGKHAEALRLSTGTKPEPRKSTRPIVARKKK